MGVPKQTLPVPPVSDAPRASTPGGDATRAEGASTVVARAYDAIAPVCCRMFVVVGGDGPAIAHALQPREFDAVSADSDDQMLASIAAGLRAVLTDGRGRSLEGVVLQPGDHPGVARATIRRLLEAYDCERGERAIMPEHAGKGGHPVLIPIAIATRILETIEADGLHRGGLRQFWIDHPELRQRVPVDDPSCIADLDTPQDYAKFLSQRE